VLHNVEDKASLLDKLRAHLLHNVIKVDQRYFLQDQGISQGSAVSTLLCNIYYGKMEASNVTVCADSELLMRQVQLLICVKAIYST